VCIAIEIKQVFGRHNNKLIVNISAVHISKRRFHKFIVDQDLLSGYNTHRYSVMVKCQYFLAIVADCLEEPAAWSNRRSDSWINVLFGCVGEFL